jgi:hypothetical protein
MFNYPKQAEFNRVVPKNKIYAHATVSKRLKELFVAQVAEIVWKYKLSPETTNLPARSGINEIQIFEIFLRTPVIDGSVLTAIDKAISFPLFFQLIHGDTIGFAGSYKRPSEVDGVKWVIEASFRTEPQPIAKDRPPLPVALDLASLYEQILRCHVPLSARHEEGIADQIGRYLALEAQVKRLHQLENRLAREKQFNRKVQFNGELREVRNKIDRLSTSPVLKPT